MITLIKSINQTIEDFYYYLKSLKIKESFLTIVIVCFITGISLGLISSIERLTAFGNNLTILNKLIAICLSTSLTATWAIIVGIGTFIAIFSSIYIFTAFTSMTQKRGKLTPYKVIIFYCIITAILSNYILTTMFIESPDTDFGELFQTKFFLINSFHILVIGLTSILTWLAYLLSKKILIKSKWLSVKFLSILALIVWAIVIFVYIKYTLISCYFMSINWSTVTFLINFNLLWTKISLAYSRNMLWFNCISLAGFSAFYIIISYSSILIVSKLSKIKYILLWLSGISFLIFIYIYILSQNLFTNQLFINYGMTIILILIIYATFYLLYITIFGLYKQINPTKSFKYINKKNIIIALCIYVVFLMIGLWGLKTSNAYRAFLFRHNTYEKIFLAWPKLLNIKKNLALIPPKNSVIEKGFNIKHLQNDINKKPNIILITVDCLRRDITNELLKDENSTITKFSKESYNFTDAYSFAAYTWASIGSMLSSKYLASKADIDYPTLPQILSINGYDTYSLCAINPKVIIDKITLLPENYPFIFTEEETNKTDTITYKYKTFKIKKVEDFKKMDTLIIDEKHFPSTFSKGFQNCVRTTVSDFHKQKDRILTANFLNFLRHRDPNTPLFAWVHYSQLHMIPSSILFKNLFSGKVFLNKYKQELKIVDVEINKIITTLKNLNMYDNSLIIITSDHGEGAKEHGNLFHIYSLYQEFTEIPLFIKLPGENTGKLIHNHTSLLDLMPTILDYLNYDYSHLDLNGKSLLPLIKNDNQANKPLYSAWVLYKNPSNFSYGLYGYKNYYQKLIVEVAMIDKNKEWKFIYNKFYDFKELYNLKKDAKEQNNLIDKYPKIADKMLQQIRKEFPEKI